MRDGKGSLLFPRFEFTLPGRQCFRVRPQRLRRSDHNCGPSGWWGLPGRVVRSFVLGVGEPFVGWTRNSPHLFWLGGTSSGTA